MRVGLAVNLRRLRIARHLSLSELARLTGASKATLSGIEHARGNPTVETLAALAGALRVPIGELLEPAPAGEIRIVRAGAAAAAAGGEPGDGVVARALDSVELDGQAELAQLSLAAGAVHEVEPRVAGARTHLLVLEGTLIAGPLERISELAAGDYAAFPADLPHVFEAPPRAAARALVLAYTPR